MSSLKQNPILRTPGTMEQRHAKRHVNSGGGSNPDYTFVSPDKGHIINGHYTRNVAAGMSGGSTFMPEKRIDGQGAPAGSKKNIG